MLRIVCLLVLAAVVNCSDVLEYTDSNFDDNMAGHDIALVEFYAPWCGHCKRLAPEYEKAATALTKTDPPVPLIKVDCTAETKVCGKYGVSGYPTLKIFRKGTVSEDYNGPREEAGIVKLMKSKAGPTSKELKNEADATKTFSSDEAVIVAFLSKKDSDLDKAFKSLADSQSSNFNFAHTYDSDLAAKYKHTDEVVIFRPKRFQNKFEDKELAYSGDATSDKLTAFVRENINGLCGHRTQGNADQFNKRPLVVAYYSVDYVKNTKGTNYWRNRVMKVAKKLKDAGRDVHFAISDHGEMNGEMSEMNLNFEDKAPVIGARDSRDRKFVMSDAFSMDNLEKFVNDLLDDKLTPYLKSEPVPEDNDGPVKTIVAKNFDEIVNDETKDVLIEFYAPWCGHCKNLEPKYNELGEKMKGEDSIVIAKMDATANDVPSEYQVQGFPTIYFSPKGSKSSPRQYQGGREVEDFVKYLAKESTDPLKTFTRDGKPKKSEL